MSRMAIIALGLALFGATACENLGGWGSDKTDEGRSTTSGGAALGTPGSNGPATGAPRTTNSTTKSNRSSPGDLTRQGTIPGEDMLD
jgi:hypothetical protein